MTLSGSGGVMVVAGNQVTLASGSKLTVPVNVGAVGRIWSVTVKNPDGQVSNAVTLTVHYGALMVPSG